MKKVQFVIPFCLLITGCSSLGDIQALNDLGPIGKQFGQTLRTVDSSCQVLTGHSCDQPVNTAQINRTYGEAKRLPYYKNAPLDQQISEIKQFW